MKQKNRNQQIKRNAAVLLAACLAVVPLAACRRTDDLGSAPTVEAEPVEIQSQDAVNAAIEKHGTVDFTVMEEECTGAPSAMELTFEDAVSIAEDVRSKIGIEDEQAEWFVCYDANYSQWSTEGNERRTFSAAFYDREKIDEDIPGNIFQVELDSISGTVYCILCQWANGQNQFWRMVDGAGQADELQALIEKANTYLQSDDRLKDAEEIVKKLGYSVERWGTPTRELYWAKPDDWQTRVPYQSGYLEYFGQLADGRVIEVSLDAVAERVDTVYVYPLEETENLLGYFEEAPQSALQDVEGRNPLDDVVYTDGELKVNYDNIPQAFLPAEGIPEEAEAQG